MFIIWPFAASTHLSHMANLWDDTLVSVRSFLKGYLKLTFSMHDHAVCKLASDTPFIPSLARKFEPFFHLQLTLGRGNSSITILFHFVFLLHVL